VHPFEGCALLLAGLAFEWGRVAFALLFLSFEDNFGVRENGFVIINHDTNQVRTLSVGQTGPWVVTLLNLKGHIIRGKR